MATRPFLSRRPTQAPVAGSTNTLSTFPSFFRKAHCDDDDDDDEPVDMMPTLREQCKPNCMKEFGLYEKCGERVTEKGSGDCEAWYFDFLKCIDRCVAPKIFQYTK